MKAKVSAVVVTGKKVDTGRAERLAKEFDVPLVNDLPQSDAEGYFHLTKDGLTYHLSGSTLKGDFNNMLDRISKEHIQHEILLKTANMPEIAKKKLENGKNEVIRVIDCTAGLGEDSLVLAAGGAYVDMCEHNPVTYEILYDTLLRAKKEAGLREIVARMSLHYADSKEYLSGLDYRPDIIYLDPMYPEKKKSAESKKKLQGLHKIEAPCSDEEELINAALMAKPGKIIIKRPPDGPLFGGRKPNYSVTRKAVRYDVII